MTKSIVQSSFGTSKQKEREIQRTLHALDAVKMLSLYVLRNQGWSTKRLGAFNDKWNEYLEDVCNGLFTLEDIANVIESETGLSVNELRGRANGAIR